MGNFTALSTDNLPSDVYYLHRLTSTDLSGVVWVVCTVSLTYALICSGVRFTLRRSMYGFDDAALLVSTLACIVQHVFIFVALGKGLGLAASMVKARYHEALADSTYTRLVLFFVVHYLAKISLTLFTRRLFVGQARYNQVACDILLLVNIIFGVVSILLMSISCPSGWYFAKADICRHVFKRWIVIKSIDIAGELALVIMPIILICKILLDSKHKLTIICTFAARLPVIAFTMLHFYYLRKSFSSHEERGISLIQPVIWLQITLLWSMVTASLPSFRPLVSPFNTVMKDSTDRSTSAYASAGIVTGSGKDKTGEPSMTWAMMSANQARMSQLEPVESSDSQRAENIGHNETIIQGPKRKLFKFSKKEADIELGVIQRTKGFEVSYEEVATPSRWSKVWRESESTFADNVPAPAEAARKPDETPAPRRRSTYAFVDETDPISEILETNSPDRITHVVVTDTPKM